MVQKKQKGVGIALNMLLVLIIAALYLVTSQPDMLPVPTSGSPVYRGEASEKLSLQWIVNYNAKSMHDICLLYTSPSPRDKRQSRMPASA